jgi:hypothetical protein
METSSLIYFILTNLAGEIPRLIVIFAGFVYCFSKWSRYPKAGKTAFAGLLILFLLIFLGLIASVVQVQMTYWRTISFESIGYFNFALRFLLNVISAIGLGLIIYAVWLGRDETQKK